MTIKNNQDVQNAIYDAIYKELSLDGKFKIVCKMLAINTLLMDMIVLHVPEAKSSIEKAMKEAQGIMEH